MDDDDVKFQAYKVAFETRNLEVNLFWQRSNYFLVLNTAIGLGFLSRDRSDKYQIVISVVGVLVAWLWLRVNLGSKYWQSRWEQRLSAAETAWRPELRMFSAARDEIELDVRVNLMSSPGERRMPRRLYEWAVVQKPSVSKSMTFLSLIFLAGWACAIIFSVQSVLCG